MGPNTAVITQKESSLSHIAKLIWSEYSVVIVFIVIFAVCVMLVPRIAAPSNIMIILRHSAIIGMMALGMTFVIIAGGIDLSSGHVLAAAGTVLILLQGNESIPLPVTLLACVAVATSIGVLNGFIITKFKLPAFIVTLAVGIIARSLAMFALGGMTIRGRNVPEFTRIGLGSLGIVPIPLIIWTVSAVILGLVLAYTKYGTYVYAVGGNENAAKYSGISVDKIRISTYALAGLCVGIATILDLSRMAAVSATTSGNLFEFEAITAAVVGGTALSGGRGKILGTFIGMILIGLVSNLMAMMQLSPFLAGTVKGIIILAAVLLLRRDQ